MSSNLPGKPLSQFTVFSGDKFKCVYSPVNHKFIVGHIYESFADGSLNDADSCTHMSRFMGSTRFERVVSLADLDAEQRLQAGEYVVCTGFEPQVAAYTVGQVYKVLPAPATANYDAVTFMNPHCRSMIVTPALVKHAYFRRAEAHEIPEESTPVRDDLYISASPLRTVAVEGYPDDNPKTVIGATKPPLSCVPPVAMFQLGQAMKDGEAKYGLMNWREHKVSSDVYYNAAMRHLMSWWDGEDKAEDSGVHHLAHAMACMAILLDAENTGQLNDNRPKPGKLAAFVKEMTEAAA